MIRLIILGFLALFVGCLSDPARRLPPQKSVDKIFLERQIDIFDLFYHIHEPTCVKKHAQILTTWSIEKNIEHFSNVTAVKIYSDIYDYALLPRGVPFTIMEPSHKFEAETLFNVLHSAKDYDAFYNTAVWARQHVNEGLFVYVMGVVINHRPDTVGLRIPHIYEIFPSFFNNGEIMTTAQRINTHGTMWVEHYPHTYKLNNNVVIKANYTFWPYYQSQETLVDYFTNDYGLNTWYYNNFVAYPSWLGGDVVPLIKDRRGEWFWFKHKQLLSRYYMERLSNGLGEIDELSLVVPIEEGYNSGLLYHNGIPFPVRQNHLDLKHHKEYIDVVTDIRDYEHRIRDAVDKGYIVNDVGEHVSLRTPEAIDILGRLVEANVDSPNTDYYRDFLSLWKYVLGNAVWHHSTYHNVNLVLPGIMDHYQTALRDPAFYMLWKRVMTMFSKFHQHLPMHKHEELALPSVVITNVEVQKLLTYFENTYMNVTNHLHMDQHEAETEMDKVSVVVQRSRLNHKGFKTTVNVTCEEAKTLLVRFFLGPKHNSEGHELPLHENYENFFLLDSFTYDCNKGENAIKRDSTENMYTTEDWTSSSEFYHKIQDAIHGNGKFMLERNTIFNIPERLLLPKGKVGGMPFLFMVYISEYKAPKIPFGTGYDPVLSPGFGTGARFIHDEPLGYPVNRPLHDWQVKNLGNLHIEDVLIYHKHTPDTRLHLE